MTIKEGTNEFVVQWLYFHRSSTPPWRGAATRKHSILMSKCACRGNPLTPMPPAGGNFSATLPKGSLDSMEK